jgi:hypothetical protein
MCDEDMDVWVRGHHTECDEVEEQGGIDHVE